MQQAGWRYTALLSSSRGAFLLECIYACKGDRSVQNQKHYPLGFLFRPSLGSPRSIFSFSRGAAFHSRRNSRAQRFADSSPTAKTRGTPVKFMFLGDSETGKTAIVNRWELCTTDVMLYMCFRLICPGVCVIRRSFRGSQMGEYALWLFCWLSCLAVAVRNVQVGPEVFAFSYYRRSRT